MRRAEGVAPANLASSMATETLIIVVGGDYLAYEICREILKTSGQRIALLWKHQEDACRTAPQSGHGVAAGAFTGRRSNSTTRIPRKPESLRRAGLAPAKTKRERTPIASSQSPHDDRLNLRVALWRAISTNTYALRCGNSIRSWDIKFKKA